MNYGREPALAGFNELGLCSKSDFQAHACFRTHLIDASFLIKCGSFSCPVELCRQGENDLLFEFDYTEDCLAIKS